MSNVVDTRIVEMQFDNKDFEQNVQTSVKTLDKLKNSLNLQDSAKGLNALEKAGHSFSLDGMASAVEAVTSKFSVLGTIGDQVLRRLTDAALNAFNQIKNVVNQFTVEPIKTGFDEYETQINAIQTILSNTQAELTKKGYSDSERLDLVNDRLDQLNHYADKTIYNFTEMTKNIGTFTAAGVELDTAVESIQGIANLAAISGSTSEQASRAMYQLSQAMSTGTVKLMDWNSVVNAGMGGKVFQDALVRTASAMGVTVDKTVTTVDSAGKKVKKTVKKTVRELIEESGSFRESLSDGWLSSEVLTNTLEQFSWDFEQIAKDTVLDDERRKSLVEQLTDMYIGQGDDAKTASERAKKMIGDMTNLTTDAVKEIKKAELLAQGYSIEEADEIIRLAQEATEAATKVKTLTQLFDTLKEAVQSGWTQTWEYIIGDFNEAKETLTAVSDYFGKIIGDSADARNAIFKAWHDKGGRDMLFNNDPKKGDLGALWNLIYGIQNIVSKVKEEFQKIFPPATSKTLLDFTKNIQKATADFLKWTETSDNMEKIRQIAAGIGSAFGIVKDVIGDVVKGVKKLFNLENFSFDKVLDFFVGIGNSISKLRDTIGNSEGFKTFRSNISNIISKVREVGLPVFNSLKDTFTKLWGDVKSSKVWSTLGNGINYFADKVPAAIDKLKEFGKSIVDHVKNSEELTNAWNKIKTAFTGLKGSISKIGQRIKDSIKAFFDFDFTGEGGLLSELKARFNAFTEKLFSKDTDWFGSLKTSLSDAWNGVKEFISTLFTKTIPEFFGQKAAEGTDAEAAGKQSLMDQIKNMLFPSTGNAGEEGAEQTGGLFDSVKTALSNAKTKIKDSVSSFLTTTLPDLFTNLSTGKKSFSDYIKDLLFPKKEEGGKTVAERLKEIWPGIKEAVSNFFKGVWEKLQNADWNKIMNAAYKIAKIVSLFKATTGLSGIGAGIKNLGKSIENITKYGASLSKNGLIINGKGEGSLADSLLKIAAAIAILVGSVYILANMEDAKLQKGLGILTGLAIGLLGVAFLFKSINFNGSSALKLAAAILLLVIPIKMLAAMKLEDALAGIFRLGAILLELALFSRLAKSDFKGNKSGFIGMAIAVNLLVIAIKNIAKMDSGDALKGLFRLGVLFAEIAAFTRLASKKKISGMISMAIGLNLMVMALKSVAKMNLKSLLKGILGLGSIMIAFGVMTRLIKGFNFGSALSSLLVLAGVLVGFAAAFKYLDVEKNADQILKFAVGLSAFMVAFGVMTKILSTIPVSGALNAVGVIAIITVAVGAIAAGLGALQNEFPALKSLLHTGGEILYEIGLDINKFIRGLLGLSEVDNSVENIGQNAADPADYQSAIDVAENISKFAEKVPEQDLWTKLLNIFGNASDFAIFSRDVGLFGEAMKSYATAISGFDATISEEDNARAIAAAEAIGAFANSENIPKASDLEKVAAIFGANITDFGMFIDNIGPFGKAMEAYASAVSGITLETISEEKTKRIVSVAEGIGAFASSENLPKASDLDKIFSALFGTNVTDFSLFIQNIGPFGKAMEAYAASVAAIELTDIPKDKTDRVISVAESIGKFAVSKNIPKATDLDKIAGIFGQNVTDFSLFIQNIGPFGKAMEAYASSMAAIELTDIPKDKTDYIISAANSLAVFANSDAIPEGTALDKIGKMFDKNVTDFGLFIQNIGPFGKAMQAYSIAVSGINLSSISEDRTGQIISVAKSIATFAGSEDIPEFTFLEKLTKMFDKDVSDFSMFVDNIGPFATAMAAYSMAMQLFNAPEVADGKSTALLSAAKSLATFAGSDDIPKFTFLEKVVSLFDKDVSNFGMFINNIGSFAEVMSAYGTAMQLFDAPEVAEGKGDALLSAARSLGEFMGDEDIPEFGFLEQVGTLFNKKISNFDMFTADIEPFTAAMSAYGNAVKDFNAPQVAEGKGDALLSTAKSLAEFMSGEDIPEFSFLEQVGELFNKKITDFDMFLADIGPLTEIVGAYADAVKDFNAPQVAEGKGDALLSTAKSLAEFMSGENIPEFSFLEQVGELFNKKITDFDMFLADIGPLSEIVGAYADAVKDFDAPQVAEGKGDALLSTAKSLAEFMSGENIPEFSFLEKVGELFDWKISDFDVFLDNIGPFAEVMGAYAESIKGFSTTVTPEDSENAINAMGAVRDFAETLDPSGSIWDTLNRAFGTGSKFNTLKEYANSMVLLGQDLETFSNSIKEVDTSNVANALQMFTDFKDEVEALESKGGIWDSIVTFFSGSKFGALSEYAGSMAKFGTDFQRFSDGLSSASMALTNFETAKNMFTAFSQFAKQMNDPETGYDGDDPYNMIRMMSDCGTAMNTFNTNLGMVSPENLGAAANAFSAITTLIQTLPVVGEGISVQPIQDLLNSFSQITIPEFDQEGLESAQAFIDGLADGISGGAAISAFVGAVTGLSSDGASAADSTYGVWMATGNNLGAGLAAGISAMAGAVRASAVNIASGAIRSIQFTWSVHSPSKVGEELGMFFDMGIAGGLDQYSKVVSGTAADMGQSVVDSASTMLRGVDGSIFDNIDPNPTIRPVMDLTNVQNGVNTINGMFDPEHSQAIGLFRGMNLSKGINHLNLEGGRITGSFTDKNIVTNLEGLQNKFENLADAVTNMQLVLDTGALVGGTSAKMDNELGTLAMRRGRGN